MTKTKSTKTGAKRKAQHATVEDRARAIVADVKGYDSDTRKSIRHMLETKAEDLGEYVAAAESGSSVLDLTRIDKEQLTAARAVVRLLALPGLPVWLGENIDHMLRVASADKRININRAEDDATPAPANLADLFAVVPARDHYKFERGRDFAELLVAAVKHPDCPAEIYNAVAECDCIAVRCWDTPEFIRLALGSGLTAGIPAGRGNDLAQMVSAVLKHPDTPGSVYDALRFAIAGLTEADAVNEDPAVIGVALAVHKAGEKGGE
jgi:hypothetical protein